MELFVYPEAATTKDGYGIGVDFAYKKITPQKDDIVIWLSSYKREDMLHVRNNDYVFFRKNIWSFKSIFNMLRGRNPYEFSKKDLLFLKDYDFDVIHCDEVIFYRSLRKIFPKKKICIRFHNCFSRISVRNSFLKRGIGVKYKYSIYTMSTLEKKIFKDKNVYKIFISDEDRDFYCSIYGIYSDSETWQYSPNFKMVEINRKPISFSKKIVWFGGIEAHKECSILWFINVVFPIIKKTIPDVEFHLWGRNTDKFDCPERGIFAHGFFAGDGIPLNDCLYINPDIIGGGIKLKLMTFMEKGIPFISTPFGYEGYKKEWMDDIYCNVVEEGKWAKIIIAKLQNGSNE